MYKSLLTRYIQILWTIVVALLVSLPGTFSDQVDSSVAAQSPADATSTMTSTGFFYPLGKDSWTKSGGTWLGRDAKNDTDGPPAYFDSQYHLGVDMLTALGDPVYAITNGEVWSITQNGWGTDNVGIVIKHTLDTGAEFLALYAHVRSSVKVGERVSGGVKFATIGPWSNGNHLHFGIRPTVNTPLVTSTPSTIGWGLAGNSWWPSTNGFVDPVEWIKSRAPKCGSATSEKFRPSGGIPVHPNGSLIKGTKDTVFSKDTVYLLQGGRKRVIPTSQRLYELYGPGRGFDFRDVITVLDSELVKYDLGDNVTGPLQILPLPNGKPREPDGRLIRQRGKSEIAIVSEGRARPFATWVAFLSLGYLPCNVATVDDYNDYPPGDPVELTMSTSITEAELADLLPPRLTITSHTDEQHVSANSITVRGTATDDSLGNKGISTVLVNGESASNGTVSGSATANWSKGVSLKSGPNEIVVTAKDASVLKNSTTRAITVFLDTQPPTPAPTPTFKITGRVMDANGVPQIGVEVNYGGFRRTTEGDFRLLRPESTYTDNQGHYVIDPAFGGFTYNVAPQQQNGLFYNPRTSKLENLNRDQTLNFIEKNSPLPPPEIMTEPNTDRAISMESVSQQGDPFQKVTSQNLDADSRTRVSLFVSNLDLPPGEFLWDRDIYVNAVSAIDQSFSGTTLEFVERVSDFTFLHQLVVRLPDDPGIIGDYLLRLNFLGSWSNSARITILPIGVQFLPFAEGDPKTTNDGIVVSTATNSFELKDPLNLKGTRDGFTFTIYQPSNATGLQSLSLNIISQKPPGPCRVSFGVGGGNVTGRVLLNGVSGSFINVTQSQLETVVKTANAFYPGCDFSRSDLFIGRIFLYGSTQFGVTSVNAIDAVSLGRGQNLFSGEFVPVPVRP
jgi:murein DD-endopeptidase MepM/ murein hydrolase activator NlpD